VEQAEPTRTAAGGVRRVAAEHVVRQRQTFVTFGLGELSEFATIGPSPPMSPKGRAIPRCMVVSLLGWLLVSR